MIGNWPGLVKDVKFGRWQGMIEWMNKRSWDTMVRCYQVDESWFFGFKILDDDLEFFDKDIYFRICGLEVSLWRKR